MRLTGSTFKRQDLDRGSEGGYDICWTATSGIPPSAWNLRKVLAEGLPATKWTCAYCFNLLASCPDSSNVRMSPLQTGPFMFAHGEGLLSFKNSMQTDVPHPQCQIHLSFQPSHKWHGSIKHYSSSKSNSKIKITSSFVS